MEKGIIFGIVVAIVVFVGMFLIGGYNKLVRLRNNVKEAFSTMDVYLKKRFDLIPNLVETVKGYSKHESETFEKVIHARNVVQDAKSATEKIEGEKLVTSSLRSLFALAESYPELKANQNFVCLQEDLRSMEDEIASARRYYNGTVKMLNNAVEMFPGNLIAGFFGFQEMPLYELDDAMERENVKVSF